MKKVAEKKIIKHLQWLSGLIAFWNNTYILKVRRILSSKLLR